MSGSTKSKGKGNTLEGSKAAKRLASVVLEVLSGLRTPPEACAAVGISLQRYYTLETRAIQGLIVALEPRPRGGRRGPKPETQIAKLNEERARLERELQRAHALVRVAQRAVGLPSEKSQRDAENKRRKRAGKKAARKPKVRAKKTISKLRAEVQAEATTPSAEREGQSLSA